MTVNILKDTIIKLVRQSLDDGLNVGASGNISVRHADGYLITPSGVDYTTLKAQDLVICHNDGSLKEGRRKPSSEAPFHTAIYQHRPEVMAIVHVHSPYATAVACARRIIPAFHYMVAVAGGDHIPCADYATFGTTQLSSNIIATIGKSYYACLLANHGQIALGASLQNAYLMAQQIEFLAKQYILSCQIGDPTILNEEEMKINIEKFKDYGIPK